MEKPASKPQRKNKTEYDVSLEPCADYAWPNVKQAVDACVGRLGGFRRFVKPGERVLLKPNLLAPRPPQAAVCTQPEVARAVIQLVREAGGKPLLADSPGGRAVTRGALDKQHHQILEVSGLAQVARDEDVELVLLERGVRLVANPEGATFKFFPLGADVIEADAVISLPRLKTHMETKLTGAVKNLYGCVPGLRKMEYHLTAQKAGKDHFADMLVDLNLLVRPRLSVMDAVVAMEGPGPATGEPRKLGWLAASADTFALDLAACALVGFEPDYVPTVRRAVQRGLGPRTMRQVRVLGTPVAGLAVQDFARAPPPPPPRRPGRSRLWYLRMRTRQKFLARTYKVPPYAGTDCDACGSCVEACPVGVAELKGGRAQLGGQGCIRCWSCAAACIPDLVVEKPSLVARWLT